MSETLELELGVRAGQPRGGQVLVVADPDALEALLDLLRTRGSGQLFLGCVAPGEGGCGDEPRRPAAGRPGEGLLALLPVQLADAAAPAALLRSGDLTFDRSRQVAWRGDRAVHLTPAESAILAALMASPGQIFTRGDLQRCVRGTEGAGQLRTVDVHIRNLRHKVERDPRRPQVVETVYRAGYRCPGPPPE